MFDSKSAVSGSLFQSLYNLERRLEEALYSGEGYKTVPHILAELAQYTRFHFSTLGTLADHYQHLANQVSEWVSEHSNGLTILTGEILYFLRIWLTSHFHLSALESTNPS
ncbi:MAG: hypothetical protein V7629_17240 [Motiliproteus sp.]